MRGLFGVVVSEMSNPDSVGDLWRGFRPITQNKISKTQTCTMQTDNHNYQVLEQDHQAPIRLRRSLWIVCTLVWLFTVVAYTVAEFYQPSIHCQAKVRAWSGLNIIPVALLAAWMPFNATHRPSCLRRFGWVTSMLCIVAQIGFGVYVLASSPDFKCMMNSVHGVLMAVLLFLDVVVMSLIGVLSMEYRLF